MRRSPDNVNKPIRFTLDGELLSAPVVRNPILGGGGTISGIDPKLVPLWIDIMKSGRDLNLPHSYSD